MITLGDTVDFDLITRSDTGVADADAPPTFEVFESANDTPIVTGTMTKRTGKTGNYRGQFVASTGNGFEADKWYNVVAAATVGGVSDKTIALRFKCLVTGALSNQVQSFSESALEQLAGVVVTLPTYEPITERLHLIAGDDYTVDLQRARDFTMNTTLDLTGATAVLRATRTGQTPKVVTALSVEELTPNEWRIRFELDAAFTTSLHVANGDYTEWNYAIVVTMPDGSQFTPVGPGADLIAHATA